MPVPSRVWSRLPVPEFAVSWFMYRAIWIKCRQLIDVLWPVATAFDLIRAPFAVLRPPFGQLYRSRHGPYPLLTTSQPGGTIKVSFILCASFIAKQGCYSATLWSFSAFIGSALALTLLT